MEEQDLNSLNVGNLTIPHRKMKILKWCALVLCAIGLVFVIYRFALPKHFTYYDRTWEAVYNEASVDTSVIVDVWPQAGYFTEEFSLEMLEPVLPEKKGDWQAEGGSVGFLPSGQTKDVQLTLKTDAGNVHLCIGDTFCLPPNVKKERVYSTCGDLDIHMYHHRERGQDVLNAFTTVNGEGIHFSMRTDDPETAKPVFEGIVECFSWYDWDRPALNKLRPSRVPEFIDEERTYEQALRDPDFGKWFLQDVPTNLKYGEIWRRRDYYSDYLRGSWYASEHGSITWKVGVLEEDDKVRITSVSDTQNYDLSLYPRYKGEIEPYELRRKVSYPIFRIEELTLDAIKLRYERYPGNKYPGNETDDYYAMKFGVLYGDILVDVSTRDIEPEWLYEQLMKLPKS